MEDRPAGAGTADPAGDLVTAPQWRVSVDSGLCAGTGSCLGLAPEHFRLEGGVSRPVRPTVPPDERVMDAAALCPMGAIALHATDTGHRVDVD